MRTVRTEIKNQKKTQTYTLAAKKKLQQIARIAGNFN